MLEERTHQATRALRYADQRAELHQGLVEIAGGGSVGERLGLGPQRALDLRAGHVLTQIEQARQHPDHVAVEDRCRAVERDRRHRASRVAPDALERLEGIHVVGQPTAVLVAPSSAATRASKTPCVGFMMRL